ncbi:MAG TPA: DUF2784 domain-containing protein [Terracidiphilus sp.]|nr:DUF2784 domain-containing protein [Terracidiphilus sp.]
MAFLAVLVVAIHLLWLALVIFGALWTRGRPVWTALHILALLWGIVVETGPWPCPLTLAESYFEAGAGLHFYQSSFLLHYLDAIVYPNLPSWIVTSAGIAVCALNLGIYGWRWRRSHRRSHLRHSATDTRLRLPRS